MVTETSHFSAFLLILEACVNCLGDQREMPLLKTIPLKFRAFPSAAIMLYPWDPVVRSTAHTVSYFNECKIFSCDKSMKEK